MAFRRFKRRRPRVAWFPVFGNSLVAEGAFPSMGYFDDETQLGIVTDTPKLDAYPLTFDQSLSEAAQQSLGLGSATIQDHVSGQAYRLRRVVGSLVIAVGPRAGEAVPAPVPFGVAYQITAGLIVAKCDDTGALLGAPNPLKQDHASYPWIWRRSWILADTTEVGGGTGTVQGAYAGLPKSTADYGSAATNHCIDQKTARIVSNEERLFLMVGSRTIVNSHRSLPNIQSRIHLHFDYRILGSLRSTQGNRNNASR